MTRIELSQNKYAIVDSEDFEYLSQWKWHYAKGYACRWVGGRKDKKRIYMHRLIMDTPVEFEVDHINRDTLNNRRSNLRNCTSSQNKVNTKVRSDNTTGHKGVYKYGNKWRAMIGHSNKLHHIGLFDSIEDASAAYTKKAISLYGDFAVSK